MEDWSFSGGGVHGPRLRFRLGKTFPCDTSSGSSVGSSTSSEPASVQVEPSIVPGSEQQSLNVSTYIVLTKERVELSATPGLSTEMGCFAFLEASSTFSPIPTSGRVVPPGPHTYYG